MAISGVDTGLVVGQFITGVVDGSDLDDEPDLIGARGTFEFTPAASYVPVPMANPNGFTLLRETFVAVLDSEGHLCTPDPDFPTKPGTRGIRLFATDSPNASVDNWTWHVTPKFVNAAGMPIPSYIPPFDIYVLRDKVTDLANTIKVPNSTGVGKEQIVAYATSAQEAATYAARQAQYAAEEASSAGISAWEATEIAEQAMAVSALAEKVATGVQKQAADGEFVPKISIGSVTTVSNPEDDIWMSDVIRNSKLVSSTLREVFPTSMQGAKGDPGSGFTPTTLLAQNLNDVLTPGMYKAEVGAVRTVANNYPAEGFSGTLEVQTRVTSTPSVIQKYIPVYGVAAREGNIFYQRVLQAGVWSPWRTYAAQRVDDTAGRAIYTWDDLAGREQLIYGDTGTRDMSSLLANGWTLGTDGLVTLSRNGSMVTFRARNLVGTAATTNVVIPSLSTGFKPITNGLRVPIITFTGTDWLTVRSYEADISLTRGNTYGNQYYGVEASWMTQNPWPTKLPGTAVGSIPNL